MPTIQEGHVTISWPDTFERYAAGAARAGEVAGRVLGAAVGVLEREAVGPWPVKTGRSRDGLYWGVTQKAPDLVEAVIGGEAPYTQWVPFKGGRAWDRLVVDPARAQTDEIGADLGAAILAEMEGG